MNSWKRPWLLDKFILCCFTLHSAKNTQVLLDIWGVNRTQQGARQHGGRTSLNPAVCECLSSSWWTGLMDPSCIWQRFDGYDIDEEKRLVDRLWSVWLMTSTVFFSPAAGQTLLCQDKPRAVSAWRSGYQFKCIWNRRLKVKCCRILCKAQGVIRKNPVKPGVGVGSRKGIKDSQNLDSKIRGGVGRMEGADDVSLVEFFVSITELCENW